MGKLVLVRGLPGSGKSTFAKDMCVGREDFASWHHVETDMWFIDIDAGGYVFNPRYLPEAHKWCQDRCKEYLQSGFNVVVSNTFTQLWEMEPYFKMGADTVTIVECTGHYGNVHGVPGEVVVKMRARWEQVTPCWLEQMRAAESHAKGD